jgi:hypothetical protein
MRMTVIQTLAHVKMSLSASMHVALRMPKSWWNAKLSIVRRLQIQMQMQMQMQSARDRGRPRSENSEREEKVSASERAKVGG